MNASPVTTRVQRCVLTFSSPGDLVSFLLTSQEDDAFMPESEIYEEHLNRILVPRAGRQNLSIDVRGDHETVTTLKHMAIANGGEANEPRSFPPDKYKAISIAQMLRSVRLYEVPMHGRRYDNLMIAMSNANDRQVSEFLRFLWELGLHGVEIAFLRATSRQQISHLVRVEGLRHADALHAWKHRAVAPIEVFAPLRTDRQTSRFYISWGFRYPVPGVDHLAGMTGDSGLVLLRAHDVGKLTQSQWLTFQSGDLNFFRKPSEFIDIELDREVAALELQEDPDATAVPMEMALVRKPAKGPNRLWLLDRSIDRQRRVLDELEQWRTTLTSSELDEVYFAYLFEQPQDDVLNPQLIRLMQQRIGVLQQYEYAYCRPRGSTPYHLVIANQTQRQFGFSLQSADRVYYQPASWRSWGINLFLPLGMELAPGIDSNDAAPVLQRILEESRLPERQDADEETAAAGCATFWDEGADGTLIETRIQQSVPLLSQFRLLNSFQRRVAGAVDRRTRERLAASVIDARQGVATELDSLHRELLEYALSSAQAIETRFSQLEKDLNRAKTLLSEIEPRLEPVNQLVLRAPRDWVEFVNHVIETHRKITDPAVSAFDDARGVFQVGRQHLHSIALRNRDLAESISRRHERLRERVQHCDQALAEGAQLNDEVESLLTRVHGVLGAVIGAQRQLQSRIDQIEEMRRRADQMQAEIDQIDGREQAVRKRVEDLKPLHEERQRKAVEIDREEKNVSADELKLQARSSELAQRREELRRRTMQIAGQLEHIESQLLVCGDGCDELDLASQRLREETVMVDAHADAVALWAQHRERWESYLAAQRERHQQELAHLRQSLSRLDSIDHRDSRCRDHIAKAQQHIADAESILDARSESMQSAS